MIKNSTLLTAIALCVSGCVFTSSQPAQTAQNTVNTAATSKPADDAAKNTSKDNKETPAKKTESGGADKSACLKASMDGKRLIADQTFVFDYKPFPKSCFVTFASKAEMLDEKDVPRGSTFHIFKDGKLEYDFPDAFDGQTACWVEGVGFDDLNGDGDTDVIIAGSCLGAKNSYPSNAVYENYNDDFRTYSSQNQNLENLKTVGEIKDYVKKNKDKFFDN
jgi:hypothetical protein